MKPASDNCCQARHHSLLLLKTPAVVLLPMVPLPSPLQVATLAAPLYPAGQPPGSVPQNVVALFMSPGRALYLSWNSLTALT
jgi:hypothetical protein